MSDYPMAGVKNMEVKKTQSHVSTQTEDSPITSTRVIDFLADVKAEFKKINWTTPEELKTYTKIVVIVTFFLGMGIYVVDLLIRSVLSSLNLLFHWLT